MAKDIKKRSDQAYAQSSPMAAKFLQPTGTVVSELPISANDNNNDNIEEAPIDGKTYGRKDANWSEIELTTTNMPTGVLFPVRQNSNAALTHIMPTQNQQVTDRRWINANWGQWTDIVTFVAADDVADKEVEFIPGNSFFGKLWISSDIERPNTQLRLRIADVTDDTELVVATTNVNLLNISSIHTPVNFKSKHLELRVMPFSRVQITLQAMVLAQGIQIGVVSNVPGEISYITITSSTSNDIEMLDE